MMSLDNIIIVHLRMSRRNQFLLFPLLRKQGKPGYTMMIYTVNINYSKHGASDEKHFEMTYYNDCGKGMTAQKQRPPSLPSQKR